MPIRIGVQVDSGNKIGKLAKDLDSMGKSTEKVAGGSKKMAAGLKTAGAALGSFQKQSVDAQKAAQGIYNSWLKLSKLKPIDADFDRVKAEFKEAKIGADKLSLAIRKSRDEYYKFTQTKSKLPKLSKEYKKAIDVEAEEKARKMLEQSEGRYATALAKSIALKEKGYQASLKRVAGAEKEAAALAKLIAMGVKLDSSTTGVKQLGALNAYSNKGRSALGEGDKVAAKARKDAMIATEKLIATENRLNAIRASAKLNVWEKKRELELKITEKQLLATAAAEAKLQAARSRQSGSAVAAGLASSWSPDDAASRKQMSGLSKEQVGLLSKSTKEMDKHGKSVGNTTKEYKKMNAVMRGAAGGFGKLWMSYGGSMVGMTAGFAAAATAMNTFKKSFDFEYITKYTSALDNSTGALGKIQKNILDLRGVASSPVELAEGFREMVKAGKEVGEVLDNDVLKTMSRFSTVSGQDLASSIQLAVTQVNAFAAVTKKSTGTVLDYATAADMMTAAVHSAPITFSDLTQSLAHTTELATTVGASFDEITTALALMGEAGIKSSKAGTSLRTGLTKLMSPTGNVAKQFKALGINLREAFDADGTMNVKKALMMYKKAYETLDPLSKVRFMKESLGLRSQKAIAALMRELDNWDDRNKEIKDSAGEINRVYEDLRDTVKISSKEFANAFTSEAIKEITPMLMGISKAFQFAEAHVEELVALLKTAVQVTGLLIAVWAGGKLIKAIRAATKAVLVYNAAVAAGAMAKGGGSAAALYGTAAGASFAGTFIAAVTASLVGWNIGRYLKDKLDVPDIGDIGKKLIEAPGTGSVEQLETLATQIEFYKGKIEKLEVEPNLNYDRIEEFREQMGLASIQYELLESQVAKEKLFDKANAKMLKTLDDFKMEKIEVDLSLNGSGFKQVKVDMEAVNLELARGEAKAKDFTAATKKMSEVFKKVRDEKEFLEDTKGMSELAKENYKVVRAAEAYRDELNLSEEAMRRFIAESQEVIKMKRDEAEATKLATDSLKDYKDTLKDIDKFKISTGQKLEGFQDQEVEIEMKIKAGDSSEADALLAKYKKLFKESRGGRVAGSDKQLAALAKQYREIDTEKERTQKLQLARAKEFETLADLAAKKGSAGYKEQVHYLEKARAIYESMDTSVDKVTKKQVAAAKQAFEYQQRITGGGKRAYGDAGKAYDKAKADYIRLAKAEREGKADPKKETEALKEKLGYLKKNSATEQEAARTHLQSLNTQAAAEKKIAEGYGATPEAINKAITESASTVDNFHKAWIADIKTIQEGYGSLEITAGGKPVTGGNEIKAGAKTDYSAEEKQLKLGKLAVAEEKKLAAAKQQTGQVAAKTATESAASVAAAKEQTTISKEAAANIVLENDKINGAVAGATELIVKIGDEWTNVDSKIMAAGVSVEENTGAVEESRAIVKIANSEHTDQIKNLTGYYENLTAEIGKAAAAAQQLSSATGNYGAGATGGARAAGGPVSSDKTYMVGEKGPELFSPTSSGYIIPNNQLTTNQDTVNINLSVNDEPPVVVQGTAQSARDIAAMFNRQQRLASK